MLPSAHPSPQPKRHLDRFSHFFAQLTAECPGMLFPLKIAPSHGGSVPRVIHGSLSPPEPTAETASQSVQTFLRSLRQSVNGHCPFGWGSAPHLIYMLPWAHPIHHSNGISIGSAVFAQITSECRRACRGIPSPSKLSIPMWRNWTPSNTWFLEST